MAIFKGIPSPKTPQFMKKALTLAAGLFLSATAFAQTKVLIIDAGHGGQDAGAIAATGSAEKNVNLQLAQVLGQEARAAGYTVVMTREDDASPSLSERAALRDRYRSGNVHFVSLHLDAAANENQKGITIHYDAATAALTEDWRKKLSGGMEAFGSVETSSAGLAVLRGSSVPALSVSPGYISNMEDLQKVSDPAYQQQVAKAIIASMQ
jgi:N-acetylmuramoyl-L-alanine amidase